MGFAELFLIAIGLSMDAFAVAICEGLTMRHFQRRKAWLIALFFGGFQMLMPVVGWIFGIYFADRMGAYDHWVAFLLLAVIGGNMVQEAFSEGNDTVTVTDDTLDLQRLWKLLLLAIATSIDALAVGLTFAMLEVRLMSAVTLIGCTTFLLSLVGVVIGHRFGMRYRNRAELTGGIILILIGLKILLEHLDVL